MRQLAKRLDRFIHYTDSCDDWGKLDKPRYSGKDPISIRVFLAHTLREIRRTQDYDIAAYLARRFWYREYAQIWNIANLTSNQDRIDAPI